jgi:hypothetical protein
VFPPVAADHQSESVGAPECEVSRAMTDVGLDELERAYIGDGRYLITAEVLSKVFRRMESVRRPPSNSTSRTRP